MKGSLIAVIIINALCAFEYSPQDAPLHPFLQQFSQDKPLSKIEEFFRNFAKDNLFLKTSYKGGLKETLTQLVQFDWMSIDISELKELDSETLKTQLATVLSNNEKNLLADKLDALEADLKVLSRRILIRAIQLNRVTDIPSLLITEEKLKSGIQEFKIANKLHPINTGLMTKSISDRLAEFTSQIVPLYVQLLVFQQKPFVVFDDFVRLVLMEIREEKIKINANNRQLSLDTILTLIACTAHFYSTDATGYEYLPEIARAEVLAGVKSPSRFLKAFFTSIYEGILKRLSEAHTIASLNEAKMLFVEFFLPEDYSAPTMEYLRFLMLRYAEEGLKPNGPESSGYNKILKVYHVDLLFTSVHHKFELIPEKQVREVIEKFQKFVDELTLDDMSAFNYFRGLLISNGELLERYEQFFGNFYNLGLMFVQYLSWKGTKAKEVNFGERFDRFLDEILKRDGGFLNAFWNGSIPSEEELDMNIIENYVAYKLINLHTNPSGFSAQTLKFSKYDDLQDKIIEELLFENEKFNEMIITLKELYLNNQALNYGAFSNLSIDGLFFAKFKESNPGLFIRKFKLNIV